MLGKYRDVDVAVVLAIVATMPALVVLDAKYQIVRSRLEPLAVVAALHLLAQFKGALRRNHIDFPGLFVHRRWSKTGSLQDIIQLLRFDAIRLVCAHRAPLFCQFQESIHTDICVK